MKTQQNMAINLAASPDKATALTSALLTLLGHAKFRAGHVTSGAGFNVNVLMVDGEGALVSIGVGWELTDAPAPEEAPP